MKYRTTLQKTGGNTTGFEIPAAMVEGLGAGKRPPVVVTLNGNYTYRNTVAPMGGSFWIGVSAEHRAKSGVAGGDEIEVELVLDTVPRTVEIPKDLEAALVKDGEARNLFDRLSYSRRKEYVRAIEEAKTHETRERRILKTVEQLRANST